MSRRKKKTNEKKKEEAAEEEDMEARSGWEKPTRVSRVAVTALLCSRLLYVSCLTKQRAHSSLHRCQRESGRKNTLKAGSILDVICRFPGGH